MKLNVGKEVAVLQRMTVRDLRARYAEVFGEETRTAELTELCAKHEVLQDERGEGSSRSQSTRIGVIAGRYVGEHFELSGERSAVFHRSEDRNGKLYRVAIVETGGNMRNVCPVAERLRNVELHQRSAP